MAIKVTVTNGTAKPLDLTGVSIQATAGEQALEQVFNSAKGPWRATPDATPVSANLDHGLRVAPGERTDSSSSEQP